MGPRPALHNQDDLKTLRTEKGLHKLKPGITGWAQVVGSYDSTIENVQNKLKLDFFYIENISLILDMKILFMTVWSVLKMEGQ